MREFARPFYTSGAWKLCRASYIASVHGLCERCGAGGFIVHHKTYLSEQNIHDPSVTLCHSNLELLCLDCHNEEHHGRKSLAKGLRFDAEGQIRPRG